MSALDTQVGGSHYRECAIQPVEFIEANKLQFLEGAVVKRMCRHDKPSGKGRQDIEKAIHELQLLLELRYPNQGEAQGSAVGRNPSVSEGFMAYVRGSPETFCKICMFEQCRCNAVPVE